MVDIAENGRSAGWTGVLARAILQSPIAKVHLADRLRGLSPSGNLERSTDCMNEPMNYRDPTGRYGVHLALARMACAFPRNSKAHGEFVVP